MTYRLKKFVLIMLVIYRMTDTATAFIMARLCSMRGMSWRYSPSMCRADTFFVSARRICPWRVSRQKRKVMNVLSIMVQEKTTYSTRMTGTTE